MNNELKGFHPVEYCYLKKYEEHLEQKNWYLKYCEKVAQRRKQSGKK